MSAPPAARAADYTVSYCRGTSLTPKFLYDWVAETTPGGAAMDRATSGCADGSDDMVLDWTTKAQRQPGARVAWTLRAEDGNRIVNWEAAADGVIPSTNTALELTGLGACLNGGDCEGVRGANDAVQIFGSRPPASQDSISFLLECRAGAGGTCSAPGTPPGGTASARLRTNVVTFRDQTAPTLSGPVIGRATTGQPVSGVVDATTTATDAGSGVRHLSFAVDGRDVAVSKDSCAPPYDRQRPCPEFGSGTLLFDTSTLPDGPHHAEIGALDASGNNGLIWSGTLVVSNGAAIGAGSDPALRGAPNGSYGGDDAQVTAGWPVTGRKPSKNKSTRRRCKASKAYVRDHRVACQGRAPLRTVSVAYSSQRSTSIAGRLVTKAGAPIAGATIQILSTPRGGGAAVLVAQPVTDANGRFVAKAAIKNGSSRLSVGWLARARDTVPVASTALQRTVRATTTLSASPRRTVRGGRTLTLRGTLRGLAGTLKGNAIAIQADTGRGWRTVRTVRTGVTGRWKGAYRVPRQVRRGYRVRAVVRPVASYPYGTGTSATRRIAIR